MREIKFRGLSDSGWVHGHLTGLEDSVYIQVAKTRDDGGNVEYIENYLEQVVVDPATIGQYTGIKDKNGVEIYEGDDLGNKDFSLIVKFHEHQGRWFAMGGAHVIWGHKFKQFKVIGNIYENGELLG